MDDGAHVPPRPRAVRAHVRRRRELAVPAVREPVAVAHRGDPRRTDRRRAADRRALGPRGHRSRRAPRAVHRALHRRGGRPAAHPRRHLRRLLVRRPLPHLRHPHRPPRLGDRAAVLLRSRVEPRPPGARAPLPRIDVPHRLAGAVRLRPRRRSRDGCPRPAHPGDHRRPRLRDRVDVGVPVPLPDRFSDAGGARAARGGCGAPRVAVRGAGAQLRGGRRGERRVEDRARRPRLGARGAAGELPRRTARRGPREPRGDDGDDGLPRPARRRPGGPPRRRARPRRRRPRGPRTRELRQARRAVLVPRLPADDTGPEPPFRRPPAPRRRPPARPGCAGPRRAVCGQHRSRARPGGPRSAAHARIAAGATPLRPGRRQGRPAPRSRRGAPRRRRRPPGCVPWPARGSSCCSPTATTTAAPRPPPAPSARPSGWSQWLRSTPPSRPPSAPAPARRGSCGRTRTSPPSSRSRRSRPRCAAPSEIGPSRTPRPPSRRDHRPPPTRPKEDHAALPHAAATSRRSATPSTADPTGASTPRS